MKKKVRIGGMTEARKVMNMMRKSLGESSPAEVARREVKPEFKNYTIVLQASWSNTPGYLMGFLAVNKPISSWNNYVTSFNNYMTSKKIDYVTASVSSSGGSMSIASKGKGPILYDDKLMDVIDMWITDKTNWHVIDMAGRDAENKQVFVYKD